VQKPIWDGGKKKQVIQRTILPPIASSPSFIDVPHDNNISDNVYNNMPEWYELSIFAMFCPDWFGRCE
jgi:hypothetical protein